MNDVRTRIESILEQFGIINYEGFSDEIDSIIFVEMIVEIENELGIVLDDNMLVMNEVCNIDTLTSCVMERMKND